MEVSIYTENGLRSTYLPEGSQAPVGVIYQSSETVTHPYPGDDEPTQWDTYLPPYHIQQKMLGTIW